VEGAAVIRNWVVNLSEAWDDVDRLAAVIGRLGVEVAAVARVKARGKHPSSFQLLLNPELLDW